MARKKIVAFVPMRHHSERVPGKNYRSLGGKPLFHYILETLVNCPEIHQVVVDTDSPLIQEEVTAHFPLVTIIERPFYLRAGTVSMNEILSHDIVQCPADLYVQTHATNPLIRSETVSEAIRVFEAGQQIHDSLFSVTRRQVRLWDVEGRPVNHDPAILTRTQDLSPIFEENSNLYIFTDRVIHSQGSRIGKRPLMFEIGSEEALDIDTEFDFVIAELLLSGLRPRSS